MCSGLVLSEPEKPAQKDNIALLTSSTKASRYLVAVEMVDVFPAMHLFGNQLVNMIATGFQR